MSKLSPNQSSHAYGIGIIPVIVALSVVVVFYTSFYLPEQMTKPSVSHEILELARAHSNMPCLCQIIVQIHVLEYF